MNNDMDTEEITTLINIRNYIAMIVQSNYKYIAKEDINDCYNKLAIFDNKIVKLIKEMKV